MNIELHLIQNFAPSCLNRDDTNTPKSCMFGGYRRARVSSQCLKRAMRLHMRDALALPTGVRTRLLARKIGELLAERYDQPASVAEELARLALRSAGFGMATDAKERTNVGLYLSSDEISLLADAVQADWDELERHRAPAEEAPTEENGGAAAGRRGRGARRGGTAIEAPNAQRAVQAIGRTVSAADIALFGRMVAENTHMEVDAAAQVAHALSTHEAEPEMDFFTAVDDLQPEAEPGAGMMGIVEYNSACFYRYALINRPQLVRNLQGDAALADRGIVAFARAALDAIPSGRQNSCAAHNPPDYVEVRVGNGLPRSLANAFEQPVRPNGSAESLVEQSVDRLTAYAAKLERMYGPAAGSVRRRSSTVERHNDGDVPSLLDWLAGALQGGD
jgi:CRISPR system Cascade subunit CasC